MGNAWLRLFYRRSGEPMDYKVLQYPLWVISGQTIAG